MRRGEGPPTSFLLTRTVCPPAGDNVRARRGDVTAPQRAQARRRLAPPPPPPIFPPACPSRARAERGARRPAPRSPAPRRARGSFSNGRGSGPPPRATAAAPAAAAAFEAPRGRSSAAAAAAPPPRPTSGGRGARPHRSPPFFPAAAGGEARPRLRSRVWRGARRRRGRASRAGTRRPWGGAGGMRARQPPPGRAGSASSRAAPRAGPGRALPLAGLLRGPARQGAPGSLREPPLRARPQRHRAATPAAEAARPVAAFSGRRRRSPRQRQRAPRLQVPGGELTPGHQGGYPHRPPPWGEGPSRRER